MDNITEILKRVSDLSENEREILTKLFTPNSIYSPKIYETCSLIRFAHEYKEYVSKNGYSKSYIRSIELSFNHLLKYFPENIRLNDLSFRDIQNFISHLREQTPRGFRVYYRTLKAAFSKAADWEYLKTNFFAKIKLQKSQKNRPKTISLMELQSILSKIKNRTVRDIIITAYNSGLRLNENLNLTWQGINLTENIITVGNENFITKGRSQRIIPIPAELNKVFSRRIPKIIKSRDAYIFCKKDGTKYSGNYVSKTFKKAARECGLDESISFHTLRHSFASNLARSGVSIFLIRELLGHASVSTTEIYSHSNLESLRGAISMIQGGAAG